MAETRLTEMRRREFASGVALVGVASAGSLLRPEPTRAGPRMPNPTEHRTRRDEAMFEQIADDLALMDGLENLQTGSLGDLALASHLEQSLAKAGFVTNRQPVTAPLAKLDRSALSWQSNGVEQEVEIWPQRPLHFTGREGLTGQLVIWRTSEVAVTAINIPDGAIVLAVLSHDRHSQLIRSLSIADLHVLKAARVAAVVLVTEGPTGATIALNCPEDTESFPAVPLATLGPIAARPLLAHAHVGGLARIVLDGRLSAGDSYNLWGRRGPTGGPLVVISTPRTGWTRALAERGPGIAAFRALMRWAPKYLPDHDFLFLNTAAHEFDNSGSARFLMDFAPPPNEVRLWLHLGAGFAARDFHELGGYSLLPLQIPDPQRFLVASDSLIPALRDAFSGESGLSQVYPASAGAAGELNEIIAAGYPAVIGLFGAHRFHHVMDDRIDKTDPAFIASVIAALQTALVRLLAGI